MQKKHLNKSLYMKLACTKFHILHYFFLETGNILKSKKVLISPEHDTHMIYAQFKFADSHFSQFKLFAKKLAQYQSVVRTEMKKMPYLNHL